MRRAGMVPEIVVLLVVAVLAPIAGCGTPCRSAELAPVPDARAARFAVLASNDLTSDDRRLEITLADADGMPITWDMDGRPAGTDVWLDAQTLFEGDLAGANVIGLGAALPWDASGGPWLTVLTDDAGGTVARLPLAGGEAQETRTVPGEPGGASSGYASGIRDVIFAPGASAAENDLLYVLRGTGADDVLVIDLEDPRGLASGGTVVGTIPLTIEGDEFPPAPLRMALVNARAGRAASRLVIGLERVQPPMFTGDVESIGPGAVAIVDPTALRVARMFEIPGMQRCGEVTRGLPDPATPDSDFVLVACRGAGVELIEQQASAGIVELEVTRDPSDPANRDPGVVLVREWQSISESGALPSRGLVALPDHAAAVISNGNLEEPRDDLLFAVDLDGAPEAMFQRLRTASILEPDTLGLGTAAFDPVSGLLVLAHGRAGYLRRRVRTDAGGALVICPGDHPACIGSEDDPLTSPVALCNRLFARSVRLLGSL